MMMKIVIFHKQRRSRRSSSLSWSSGKKQQQVSSWSSGKQQQKVSASCRVLRVPTKPRSLRKCNAKKQPFRCNIFIKRIKKLPLEEQKLVLQNIKHNRDLLFSLSTS